MDVVVATEGDLAETMRNVLRTMHGWLNTSRMRWADQLEVVHRVILRDQGIILAGPLPATLIDLI